jgi:hypothetical protein
MQQLESEERESSVLAGWSTSSTHVMEASPRASHGDVDTAIIRTLPVKCFLLGFNDNSTHHVTFKLFGSVPHFVLS